MPLMKRCCANRRCEPSQKSYETLYTASRVVVPKTLASVERPSRSSHDGDRYIPLIYGWTTALNREYFCTHNAMEPPPPTGTDTSESLKVRDRSSTVEERQSAGDIAPALVDRKHPLLSSRLAVPRSVSVIRPPSFSLRTIVSGMTTLVGYRDLLYTLTFFRLAIRYKQSALGWIWAALQPLSLMIIYTLIFSRVARVTSEGMPYPVFVFSGLLPWIFFASAVSNAINGLMHYPSLLTKMYFPREIIPLSYVFAALVDLAIACVILIGLMMYYRVSLSWNALYALPIVAVLSTFTAAVGIFLSSLQVRFRDLGF